MPFNGVGLIFLALYVLIFLLVAKGWVRSGAHRPEAAGAPGARACCWPRCPFGSDLWAGLSLLQFVRTEFSLLKFNIMPMDAAHWVASSISRCGCSSCWRVSFITL